MDAKPLLGTFQAPAGHWVGDGFPVRTLFSYDRLGPKISPFLLLDYAGPVEFPPAEKPRGVDRHPHRGFETVTYLLEGSMEHADSRGHRGRLTPGDVQWMTAGSGVVHSEMPEADFAARGGRMHGFQLWVNLPRQDKRMAPRYQEIPAAQIPVGRSADGAVCPATQSSSTGTPAASVSGTRQLGYSWSVPGWFCALRSPTASASDTWSSRAGVRAR